MTQSSDYQKLRQARAQYEAIPVPSELSARLEETIAEHEAYLAALKEHRGNDAYNILLSHLLMPIKIHDHEV